MCELQRAARAAYDREYEVASDVILGELTVRQLARRVACVVASELGRDLGQEEQDYILRWVGEWDVA
jgi:hypothetical protein